MEVVRHLPNDPFMVAVGSSQYAIGFTKAGRPIKPHFPVPAIYTKVWFGSKGVTWMQSKAWKFPVLGIVKTIWNWEK